MSYDLKIFDDSGTLVGSISLPDQAERDVPSAKPSLGDIIARIEATPWPESAREATRIPLRDEEKRPRNIFEDYFNEEYAEESLRRACEQTRSNLELLSSELRRVEDRRRQRELSSRVGVTAPPAPPPAEGTAPRARRKAAPATARSRTGFRAAFAARLLACRSFCLSVSRRLFRRGANGGAA